MRPNRLSGAAVMCRKASSRPKVSAATPATPTMALTIEPDTAQLALIFRPGTTCQITYALYASSRSRR